MSMYSIHFKGNRMISCKLDLTAFDMKHKETDTTDVRKCIDE
jgi:hypothetical protein